MYYINCFFMSSILGFLFESFFYLLFRWSGNSGYLFGPWTPVYGIGSIIIIITHNLINKKLKINNFFKFLLFFLTVCIVLSIIELIGGYLIENIFGEVFWDYSDYKLNIGKYASVEMALLWGVMATIFIYLIKPIIDKFIYFIPKIITYFLVILFVIDNIATIICKLKLL